MTVTTNDVREAITTLGLANQALCVHASLRSFGHVEGGASTIIRGLREAGCTILVPSASWDAFAVKPRLHQLPEQNGGSAEAWRTYLDSRTEPFPGTNRIYSPDTPEIDKGMGAIPTAVVANPKRIRGNHPLFSFTAIGPLADSLVKQQSPLNVFGPLKKLGGHDGAVVLMGVDLTVATILHLAEAVTGRVLFRRWANDEHGEPMEVAVGGCSDGFEQFAPHLAAIERTYRVGDSQWRVYPAQKMLSLAVQIIQDNPQITHCGNPTCDRCNHAILGGPLLAERPYQ